MVIIFIDSIIFNYFQFNTLILSFINLLLSFVMTIYCLVIFVIKNADADGFDCSWCDSNMCSERSVCTNNKVTLNGDCPNPVINNFTPTNGPPQGRTQVTIYGSNLGIQSLEILSIIFGSRTCTSNPELYVPGKRIVCSITPDDSNSVTSTVTITVRVDTTAPELKTGFR